MDAFLLYVDDWLASKKVAMMDAAEERGYLRLLLYAAKEPDCGLPDDDSQLAVISLLGHQWNRVTREALKRTHDPETKVFRTSGAKLRECFSARDGRLYNQRLLEEYFHQKEVSESRAKAGKLGNSVRWRAKQQAAAIANGTANATGLRQVCDKETAVSDRKTIASGIASGSQNHRNPNPNPNLIENQDQKPCAAPDGASRPPANLPAENPTEAPALPGSLFPMPPKNGNHVSALEKQQLEWFAQWWAEYWLRKARKEAWNAFKKHVRTEARFHTVMNAMREQKTEMMTRPPEKRPYGATWLNGARWEDETDPEPPTPKKRGIDRLIESLEQEERGEDSRSSEDSERAFAHGEVSRGRNRTQALRASAHRGLRRRCETGATDRRRAA